MEFKYDESWVPPPFGLSNGGVICYFNAMLQVLYACPAFAQWLNRYLERVEAGETPRKPQGPTIARLYLNLLRQVQQQDAQMDNGCITTQDAKKLLRYVMESNSALLHEGRQEDLNEGMLAFLGTIDPDADFVFRVRHTCYVECQTCGTRRQTGMPETADDPDDLREAAMKERTIINPPNVFMDVCGQYFASQEEAQRHIRQYRCSPSDFRCERCENCNGPVSDDPRNTIWQTYALRQISEVLILKLQAYCQKETRFFPRELLVPRRSTARNGAPDNYRYALVALVEHQGTRHGGHYYARCLRVKPARFHEARRQRLEEAIETLQKVRGAAAVQDRAKRDLARKVLALQNNAERARETLGVFNLNDAQVLYSPDGFQEGPSVFYAVYHWVGLA